MFYRSRRCMQDLQEDCMPLFSDRAWSIGFTSEPNLPPIWGDRGLLAQALLNLIVNAKEAMPDGGRVDGERATVAVFDDQRADSPGHRNQSERSRRGHFAGKPRAHLRSIFYHQEPREPGWVWHSPTRLSAPTAAPSRLHPIRGAAANLPSSCQRPRRLTTCKNELL